MTLFLNTIFPDKLFANDIQGKMYSVKYYFYDSLSHSSNSAGEIWKSKLIKIKFDYSVMSEMQLE